MKVRLRDNKAGIVILSLLLVISLVDTIIRAMQSNYAFAITELGEPLSVAIFVALILFFAIKKKERVCYICYGVFIGWFVLEEAFSLLGLISNLFSAIRNVEAIKAMAGGSAKIAITSIVIHLLTSICIVAIGVLVVEYMTDGTIYNHAFNGFCILTVALLLITMYINARGIAFVGTVELVLLLLNNLYRITMVFLFTFFAYDSAMRQLKKTKLAE